MKFCLHLRNRRAATIFAPFRRRMNPHREAVGSRDSHEPSLIAGGCTASPEKICRPVRNTLSGGACFNLGSAIPSYQSSARGMPQPFEGMRISPKVIFCWRRMDAMFRTAIQTIPCGDTHTLGFGVDASLPQEDCCCAASKVGARKFIGREA